MSESTIHIFRNIKDGLPIASAVIPCDFTDRTELLHERKRNGGASYRYSGEVSSPDCAVRIFFDSGREYIDMRMEQGRTGGVTDEGTEIRQYCDLKTQMDSVAALITGGAPSFIQFHAFSGKMQSKLQNDFDTLYRKTYQTLNQLIQSQGNLVSVQMGEPFLDGGISEYVYQSKCLFIAFSRSGYRAIIHERFRTLSPCNCPREHREGLQQWSRDIMYRQYPLIPRFQCPSSVPDDCGYPLTLHEV